MSLSQLCWPAAEPERGWMNLGSFGALGSNFPSSLSDRRIEHMAVVKKSGNLAYVSETFPCANSMWWVPEHMRHGHILQISRNGSPHLIDDSTRAPKEGKETRRQSMNCMDLGSILVLTQVDWAALPFTGGPVDVCKLLKQIAVEVGRAKGACERHLQARVACLAEGNNWVADARGPDVEGPMSTKYRGLLRYSTTLSLLDLVYKVTNGSFMR
ncbi:hypothetical protein K402DRAFT_159806 [Aulographum hederae CBS 113979]|uniref:Uncharacterized protein n=1 Tax=Aulographum hederae CBS 113979 TaxID=1176131 RepID=A0A6G1GSB8_9PEZI|nr:hypothetical protein K402DRAFT_159806 [Aulographum hederae CBS 113979]